MFANVEELKRASCTNKKESWRQPMNTCVHYEDLNVTFDGMMTMIREFSKNVGGLIIPQMSSLLINSTPIRMPGLIKSQASTPVERDNVFILQRGDKYDPLNCL